MVKFLSLDMATQALLIVCTIEPRTICINIKWELPLPKQLKVDINRETDKDQPKRGLDKDNLAEGSIKEEPMLKDWLELKEEM